MACISEYIRTGPSHLKKLEGKHNQLDCKFQAHLYPLLHHHLHRSFASAMMEYYAIAKIDLSPKLRMVDSECSCQHRSY